MGGVSRAGLLSLWQQQSHLDGWRLPRVFSGILSMSSFHPHSCARGFVAFEGLVVPYRTILPDYRSDTPYRAIPSQWA